MRENPWVAVNRGASVQERKRDVARAHEQFLRAGTTVRRLETPTDRTAPPVRSVVFDSWLRSVARLDPERLPVQSLPADAALHELRSAHPLQRLLPVLKRLLIDDAEEAGLLVAVGDAAGRLLWVEGDRRLRAEAEAMGFIAGADWSEQAVGTSAPGTALALDHGVQVMGAEHFNRHVHRWSCTAAPVHDPASGALIGVVDITGGDDAVAPQTLPLIEAAVTVLETELRLAALRAQLDRAPRTAPSPRVRPSFAPAAGGGQRPAEARLSTLGAGAQTLGVAGAEIAQPLTLRHAEILALLVWHRDGLGSRRLAELVYGSASAEGTLRAELVRLRQVLGGIDPQLGLLARPYRLAAPVDLDAARMLELLRRGAHRQALDLAPGPMLPDSLSPGIAEIREEVSGALREAVLQDASLEVLDAYAMSEHGRDDAAVWWELLRRLPAKSKKRAHVVARLERIEQPV